MKIDITAHEMDLTPEIKRYAEKKMNKLCKHYKQIISGEIVIEEDHNKTEKKAATARANIKIAGPDLSASASEKTVFAAIDEVERKLTRQLEKDKAMHTPKLSRVARSKNMIRKIFSKEQ